VHLTVMALSCGSCDQPRYYKPTKLPQTIPADSCKGGLEGRTKQLTSSRPENTILDHSSPHAQCC